MLVIVFLKLYNLLLHILMAPFTNILTRKLNRRSFSPLIQITEKVKVLTNVQQEKVKQPNERTLGL